MERTLLLNGVSKKYNEAFIKATEGGQQGFTSPNGGGVNKVRSHVRAVAQKLRDSTLTAALWMMGVDGGRIETPSFSDGKEAAEAWVAKEVVYIVS